MTPQPNWNFLEVFFIIVNFLELSFARCLFAKVLEFVSWVWDDLKKKKLQYEIWKLYLVKNLFQGFFNISLIFFYIIILYGTRRNGFNLGGVVQNICKGIRKFQFSTLKQELCHTASVMPNIQYNTTILRIHFNNSTKIFTNFLTFVK